MCWGWGKEERRSLISGSQSNYFHLFLICAEDPSGFHMKEMVATLQKGAPRECHLPKRHSSRSSPPVHNPTELMHLGRWERRFTASFEGKTGDGFREQGQNVVIRRKNSPTQSCGTTAKHSPPHGVWSSLAWETLKLGMSHDLTSRLKEALKII